MHPHADDNHATKPHALYIAYVWDWRVQGVREVARHEHEAVLRRGGGGRSNVFSWHRVSLLSGRGPYRGSHWILVFANATAVHLAVDGRPMKNAA